MGNVAAIILNYNSWEDTLKEAELVNEKAGIDWRDIIVIDNCSTNQSAQELEERAHGRYIFMQATENKGYASGNNIGLRYASENGYQYGWILNNDILFDDDKIVDKITNVFKREKQVAVVNPDIFTPDGFLYNRDCVRPSFFDLSFGMFAYRKKGRTLHDLGGYGYVYRPQGCCMMVDLHKLKEINFMDEHTFLYCEEMILAENLLRKGYKCACCTDSRVIHYHSQTVNKSLNKKKIRTYQIDSYCYYLKKYREYGDIKTFWGSMFYVIKLWLLETNIYRRTEL